MYAKPQTLQLEKREMNELIIEMLATLREMPEAIERKMKFEPAMAAARILGDKDKLKQILINKSAKWMRSYSLWGCCQLASCQYC